MLHALPRRRPPPRLVARFGAPAPVDGASALPADVVRALRAVAAEMRDMPRDCATDRHELVHWLGRLARRLDAVAASKARAAEAAAPCPPPAPETPPGSPAAAPAAVPAPVDRPAAAPAPRPREPRRMPPWRAVPIAPSARRGAEAAGQLDLFR